MLNIKTQTNLKKLLALFFAFSTQVAAVKGQQVLSLAEVFNRIEHNNIQLKSFDTKAKSYAYSAAAVKGWMAPMVGVGTFMTPYPGQMVMDGRDKGSLMFQVEQDIPNLAKQNAQYKAIAAQATGLQAGKLVKLNELKFNARRQYYTWLVAQAKLKVLAENGKVMQVMNKLEEVRYPFNQSKLGTVFQTSAKLEEIENMKRMQWAEIAKAKAWLNTLMNETADHQFVIDSALTPQLSWQQKIDTANLALLRSDVQQMNHNIQTMALNIAAMKTQAKPDFKLRFDHMSPLAGGMPNMPKAFSVMGMMSIPIAPWSAKMYKNDIKAMQLEVDAMNLEKSAMLQETKGMLFGMQQQIALMDKQIKGLAQKVMPTLKKVLDVTMLSYRENKSNLNEVINAWEAVLMMEEKVLDEKLKLYLMIAEYERETYH